MPRNTEVLDMRSSKIEMSTCSLPPANAVPCRKMPSVLDTGKEILILLVTNSFPDLLQTQKSPKNTHIYTH